MKSQLVTLLLASAICPLLCTAAQAQPAPAAKPPETLASLQERLEKHVSQPRFAAAAWGVKIASLDTGITLFECEAGKLRKPASNAKMYTGALALDRLGPDHRIKTSFYAAAKPNSSGTLPGDLIVYGRGDPSFSHRFNNDDYNKALEPILEAIANAGIKRIEGGLIGDESFFRGPPFGSTWSWEDLQYYYGAEVSALTLQENVVDLIFRPAEEAGAPCRILTKPETTYLTFSNRTQTVAQGGRASIQIYRPLAENVVYVSGTLPLGYGAHSGSVAVARPAMFFLTQLKEALQKRGIPVTGNLRAHNWLDRDAAPIDYSQLIEIAAVESRPMSEIVARMMKPSQNLYAQLLLLQVGARTQSSGSRTWTENAGLAELGKFLGEAGIARGEVLLEEGSGLSRGCLLTPNASVNLLKYMATHPHAGAFRESLPIAGVDGTLRSRLKGTPAERNVRAKTGTIRYVNALSGYVTTAAKENLAFSIMLNNYNNVHPTITSRAEIDLIAQLLAEFTGRSEE